jgi:hypothetical protein
MSQDQPITDDLHPDVTNEECQSPATLEPAVQESPQEVTLKTMVFVSHAEEDSSRAEQLIVRLLEKHNIPYFFSPHSISPTVDWQDSINVALKSSTHVVVVMSPNAAQSKWVKYEVRWALEHLEPGRIIPVQLSQCDPADIHMGLPSIQHLDFLKNPTKAGNDLLRCFRITTSRVSEIIGEDFTGTLFGAVFAGVVGGAIGGAIVALIVRSLLQIVTHYWGYEFGDWGCWSFGGSAVFATIFAILGILHAGRENRKFSNLLESMMTRAWMGLLIGSGSWCVAWLLGKMGGWMPYSFWKVALSWTLTFAAQDLLDSLLMLFNWTRLRRFNRDMLLWNGVGIFAVSSIWVLSHFAWTNVGDWYLWMLIGGTLFSVCAILTSTVDSSS